MPSHVILMVIAVSNGHSHNPAKKKSRGQHAVSSSCRPISFAGGPIVVRSYMPTGNGMGHYIGFWYLHVSHMHARTQKVLSEGVQLRNLFIEGSIYH